MKVNLSEGSVEDQKFLSKNNQKNISKIALNIGRRGRMDSLNKRNRKRTVPSSSSTIWDIFLLDMLRAGQGSSIRNLVGIVISSHFSLLGTKTDEFSALAWRKIVALISNLVEKTSI